MKLRIRFIGALCFTLGLAGPVPALEIAWYQQREAGQVAGELRLRNLTDAPLTITTPGWDLEYGIVRIGPVAIVTLTSRPGGSDAAGPLVVVASQGSHRLRATFPLHGMSNGIRSAPDRATPASTRTAPGPSTAATTPVRPKWSGSAAGSARAAPERLPVCPVLALQPGSLRANVERLLAACGARLGAWHTSADPDHLLDWRVAEPQLLSRRNTDGLAGLLAQLAERFQLSGMPDPAHSDTIDIFWTRDGRDHGGTE